MTRMIKGSEERVTKVNGHDDRKAIPRQTKKVTEN
jgi:hypothetical protein